MNQKYGQRLQQMNGDELLKELGKLLGQIKSAPCQSTKDRGSYLVLENLERVTDEQEHLRILKSLHEVNPRRSRGVRSAYGSRAAYLSYENQVRLFCEIGYWAAALDVFERALRPSTGSAEHFDAAMAAFSRTDHEAYAEFEQRLRSWYEQRPDLEADLRLFYERVLTPEDGWVEAFRASVVDELVTMDDAVRQAEHIRYLRTIPERLSTPEMVALREKAQNALDEAHRLRADRSQRAKDGYDGSW